MTIMAQSPRATKRSAEIDVSNGDRGQSFSFWEPTIGSKRTRGKDGIAKMHPRTRAGFSTASQVSHRLVQACLVSLD